MPAETGCAFLAKCLDSFKKVSCLEALNSFPGILLRCRQGRTARDALHDAFSPGQTKGRVLAEQFAQRLCFPQQCLVIGYDAMQQTHS